MKLILLGIVALALILTWACCKWVIPAFARILQDAVETFTR